MSAPLFFLPGWCLGRGPLNTTVDALNGEFFDLPGYRAAPPCDDFAAATADLASRLPENATLCGWSLGAQLALAVAAQAPEKVGKLVLVAGTASFVQRDGWPDGMTSDMLAEFTAAIAADPAAMLPRFVGGFNRGDARAKEVTRELLARADPLPPDAILASGLHWLRDVDLRSAAPKIKAPTLLIHGAADPLMPPAAAQALAERIPNSRLEIFADCAHAPFLSRPDEFLASLRRFLND